MASEGKEATTAVTSCNDNPADDPQLFERPPLEISLKIGKTQFTLIGDHWASQGHPEACRKAQAAFVGEQVKQLEAAGGSAMVIGDLNAFQDSPSMATLAAGTSLRDLWSKAPADNRYSYAYDGLLETLDHIFTSSSPRSWRSRWKRSATSTSTTTTTSATRRPRRPASPTTTPRSCG